MGFDGCFGVFFLIYIIVDNRRGKGKFKLSLNTMNIFIRFKFRKDVFFYQFTSIMLMILLSWWMNFVNAERNKLSQQIDLDLKLCHIFCETLYFDAMCDHHHDYVLDRGAFNWISWPCLFFISMIKTGSLSGT